MAEVKKIDADWSPVENPGLQVGETIHLDNVDALIEEGKVELVKKEDKKKSK